MMKNSRTFIGMIASATAGAVVALSVAWTLAPTSNAGADTAANDPATMSETPTDITTPQDSQADVRPTLDMSDVEWVLDGPQMYPFSETAGPATWDMGDPASGFAQTPEGATVAALHILGRSGESFPLATRLAVIDEQMIAGPSLNAYRAAMEAAGEPGPMENAPAQVAGCAVHSYTEDAATIEIATAQEGRYFSFILTVEWDAATDDWKLHPPQGGEDWQLEFRQLTSLEAFTPWGP